MRQSPIVPVVLDQHAEELAALWTARDSLCSAGHVALKHLARFDERIAAHQDGCLVGGHEALRVLLGQLATVSAGRIFAAAVAALGLSDSATIARCVALAEASPEAWRGMISALGWADSAWLRGIVKDLLASSSPRRRSLGVAACRIHAVNPGSVLFNGLKDQDGDLRAEAFRSVGVLGEAHLVSSLAGHLDHDVKCQFWSAWSAVLLGDREKALHTLETHVFAAVDTGGRAFRLLCQAAAPAAAHDILRRLALDPSRLRWVIEGSGIVGDPVYVTWLIRQMDDDTTARAAGEAFSLITGADLALLDLERTPGDVAAGPNDQPEDLAVAMDTDDGLPWPDPARVLSWWQAHSARFQAGVRYFVGAPVTREHCVDVLKHGYQRQRILAAHHLCLLEPGTPLLNTSAPAWRQLASFQQL